MTEENVRTLPAEIVEEILCYLPVKSLNRFRCVSKSWQSLISEYRFVRKHLTRDNLSKKTLVLSNPVGSGNEGLYFFPLSSSSMPIAIKGDDGEYLRGSPGEDYRQLLASCDGLLCIRVYQLLYIWNPCLKTYRKILTSSGTQSFYDLSTSDFGLGYDSIRDDYKLLKLSNFGLESRTETYVYSLKSDSWRKLGDFPKDYWPLKSVFVNGSIYWLASCCNFRQNPLALYSFHLSDNKYGEVTLPERWPIYFVVVKPCVIKGMLGILVIKRNSCLVLWEYCSDHKSWTKILDIGYELVFHKFCRMVDVRLFYMYENGEVLMGMVSEYGTELLVCKDKAVLFREVIFKQQCLIRYGFIHVESLISPLLVDRTSKDETVTNGDEKLNRSIKCYI